MRKQLCAALAAAALLSCKDGTGPEDGGFSVTAQTNETQFGARGTTMLEPLQAMVLDPVTKTPQTNVAVQWRVVSGNARLTSVSTMTDAGGVASTFVQLGNDLSTSIIEAFIPKLVGDPARFTVKSVDPPAITAITPGTARAGDTVTVAGQNFSPITDENVLLFNGLRGRIVSSTTTQLRAVVPLCLPTRSVTVQPLLGAVTGNQLTMNVTGGEVSALQLVRGEARTFSDPNELSCFRLPGGVAGLSVLFVPQNFSQVVGTFSAFELAGVAGSNPATAVVNARSAATSAVDDTWEWHIRNRERALLRGPGVALRPQLNTQSAACPPQPKLGDRCEFNVINKSDTFERVTAEIKAITTRAIVYQDIKTPAASGLTAADFEQLGRVFDDPIYSANVTAFGEPSDTDNNGRVFILLTPVVNALTPRASNGYIAGFFYGCDLLSRQTCSGSNEAEIFYAMTTDPGGQFSDPRSRNSVMSSLPAVIAHEFQHMINFAQRNRSQDVLWLSEGLAHHAEDIVADAFDARGDAVNAAQFRAQNTVRANRYLRAPSSFSLLAEDDQSSLELRGAAWLFVKYLEGQYGTGILAKLTRSTQSSVANVTAQTGTPWSTLLANWGVALWADDAPELAGVTLKRELTFPNMNLRERIRNSDGTYPLKPSVYGFTDFIEQGVLPASSQDYVIVRSASNGVSSSLNLSFTGQRGGAFGLNALPQMSVLRIN